jgi:cytidine deaminase
MISDNISKDDTELIEAASNLIKKSYEPGRLVTSAAVRAESGSIYTGMGLRTKIGGTGVHAEPVAMGEAISKGERDFHTVVAMTYADVPREGEPRVIAACGTCRELIASYSTDADIIVLEDDERVKIPVSESLPYPAYPE